MTIAPRHASLLSIILLLTGLFVATFGVTVAAGEPEPLWIDVRTAEELASGYVVEAEHIPHDEIAEHIGEVATDKDQPIHLFCRTGRRAQAALETLRDMGYTNLHNEGSFADVVAARPDLETDCTAC